MIEKCDVGLGKRDVQEERAVAGIVNKRLSIVNHGWCQHLQIYGLLYYSSVIKQKAFRSFWLKSVVLKIIQVILSVVFPSKLQRVKMMLILGNSSHTFNEIFVTDPTVLTSWVTMQYFINFS